MVFHKTPYKKIQYRVLKESPASSAGDFYTLVAFENIR